jgi:hypothetical protein
LCGAEHRRKEIETMATLTFDRAAGSRPDAQAYRILHLGFTVAPILAGLDKFTNLLVDWERYVAPAFAALLPFSPATFMLVVGVVEVIAGIGVFLRPRVFAYVVAAWLAGIILNLVVGGQYLDVALRDLGLALGALALGRLSQDSALEA